MFEMKAVIKRAYGEKKSAGFDFVCDDGSGQTVSLDIDMRKDKDSMMYQYGDISFRGVTIDNILSDKIYVLSTDKAYRRIKDAVDVYALSHCVKLQTQSIRDIWKEAGRMPEKFEAFSVRRADFEHAYSKLRRVEPKPEFSVVFDHLRLFLVPFIDMDVKNLTWDNNSTIWYEPLSVQRNSSEGKESVIARIRAAQQERNEEPRAERDAVKSKDGPER
jgi:hypothetical protein